MQYVFLAIGYLACEALGLLLVWALERKLYGEIGLTPWDVACELAEDGPLASPHPY